MPPLVVSAQCSAGRTMSRMTYRASLVSLGRQAGRRSACLPARTRRDRCRNVQPCPAGSRASSSPWSWKASTDASCSPSWASTTRPCRTPTRASPQDAMSRLWQRAVALSGNPAIALNIARVRRPAFHVVGYALMSSRNLAEGFARLERYQRIIAEASDLTFRRTPQGYRIGVTVHGDRLPAPPQSAECSLAYLVDMVRWITGRSLDPLAVELPGAPREPLAPYVELFRAPLRFHAEEFALVFSPRRPRDAATPRPTRRWPSCTIASPANTWRVSVPAAFTHLTRQTLRGCCRRENLSANGWPRRCTCRSAHFATAPPGRRHQLPATARRHAPGYGRTVSPAARPDLAGSRLPAGLSADPSNFFRHSAAGSAARPTNTGAPPGAPGLSLG